MPGKPSADDGAGQEGSGRAEAGGHGEAGRAGDGEPDQEDVAGHVGREDMPEAEEAHGIDEAADDGEGGQCHHQGWRRMLGVAHVRSTFPPQSVFGPAGVMLTGSSR